MRSGDGDRLLLTTIGRAQRWLAPLVVLTALGAAATLALPAVLGWTLDEVVAAWRQGESEWTATRAALLWSAGLVAVIVVVETATVVVTGDGTAHATGWLRRHLGRHVLAAGPQLVGRTPPGELVARMVTSTATTGKAVTVGAGLTEALLPPAGSVVALAVIDVRLAAAFAAGMVLISGVVRSYLRDSRVAAAGYLEAQEQVASRLVDALGGARTIAAAGTTASEVERVLRPLPDVRRWGEEVWRNLARIAFRGEPVVLLTQVAVIAVAGTLLAAGDLSTGEMLAASRYAVMAAGIGATLDELTALARGRAAADRVADVLGHAVTAYGDRALPDGPGTLELRAVQAGPEGEPVLTDLDLVVPGGSVVALVGRSGAGKSLAAALAGRLCDPTRGEVRLDGVPLDQLDQHSLRRAVAYAFERPSFTPGSVAETIGFGVDPPSAVRLREAARAACAEAFINRLPEGYEAPAAETPWSGGELQRIGLARAIAADARVLILDDATSSLDTATEAELTAALTDHLNGRTRLVVTHRATTAARADLVAWLDGGRLRALASHRELWADRAYRAAFGAAGAVPAAGTRSPGDVVAVGDP